LALIVEAPDSPWLTSSSLAPLIEIELEAHLVTGPARADVDATIDLRLLDAQTVRLELRTSTGEAPCVRTVEMGDVGIEERPRLLSLAISEFVRSHQELLGARRGASTVSSGATGIGEVAPSPPTPPAALPAMELPRAEPRRQPAPPAAPLLWSVSLSFGPRISPKFRPFFDSRLSGGVAWGAHRNWLATIDADFLYTDPSDALGHIEMRAFSVSAGFAFVATTRRVVFGAGPRLEAGAAFAEGHAHDAAAGSGTASAPIVDAELGALAKWLLVGRWWIVTGIEAGPVLSGFDARADDRQVAGLRDTVLGARLGIGCDL
jgi:hypothetical protein